MTFDMRPIEAADALYERFVNSTKEKDSVFDLNEGLRTMVSDFYENKEYRGIVYDYDTGDAYSVTPIDVGKDWNNVIIGRD